MKSMRNITFRKSWRVMLSSRVLTISYIILGATWISFIVYLDNLLHALMISGFTLLWVIFTTAYDVYYYEYY